MTAHPALVLNADFRPMSYFPLSLLSLAGRGACRVQRARLGRGRVRRVGAQPVHADPAAVRGGAAQVPAAAQRVAFTRFNVFLRDRFTCQYCGEAFASSALTFEHVIPRSRGGQTTWSNIVTACVPCNTGKGNSLRIKPRRPPKEPTLSELLAAKRGFRPAICTRAGWTTSTGTRSSRPSLVS